MASNKWKRWGKRLGVTVGILFVLYVLVGFWGVPLLIRHLGLEKLNEQVAGHGEVEAIRFNPFTWELKLENFAGYTPDGEVALRFTEFRINIQPTSYFSDEWQVLEISLDSPFLTLIVDENGQVNISSLLQRFQDEVDEIQTQQAEARAKSDEPFVIPPISIGALHLNDAGMRVAVNSLNQPFSREVKNLSFVMDNVRTNSGHDNPYNFQLQTSQGEKITVQGELRLDPLSSWGSLKFDQLLLKDFLHFAGDQVDFEMGGGALDFAINYAFVPLGKTPRLELTQGHVLLTDMSLHAKGETEPFQTIGQMEISGLGVDILQDVITLDSFTLDQAMLSVVRGEDGIINLLRYLKPERADAISASEPTTVAPQEQSTAREFRLGVVSDDQDLGVALTSAWEQVQEIVGLKWDLEVGTVDVSGVDFIWRDEYLPRPAELRWTDVTLTATKLSNGETPFPFDLKLAMNETGKIELHGTFTPTPASTAFEVVATELPLPAISPYLDNVAPVMLQSGALSASGKSEIAFPEKGLPELTAEINGNLANFALDWADPAAPLVAWQNLELSGASLTTLPMSFYAGQVKLTAPVGNIERLADGSIRLPLPESTATDAASEPATEQAPAEPQGQAAEPISIQVDEFVVTQGRVNVQDQSVSPAASFSVDEIAFRAAPLTMPDLQPMTIALEFLLANGPSGGVKVEGALSPLQPLEATEFTVNTTNVTLSPFAAYAVPIIGRPPVDGKLTASLAYSINTGEIQGQNKMRLKRLRFGKRPADTKAPDLPLELGVAILEDGKGVMPIDIPIKGNVNDPSFSIAQMVQYAIGNVLEKLAMAPFSALGSVLPGGSADSPTYVPFTPGLATLDDKTTTALDDLAQFIVERPALIATLTPSVDPKTDAEALRATKFAAMLTAKMTEDNDDAEDATETLYEALPNAETNPKSGDLTMEQQQKIIRKGIEITTADFSELAQARAEAVRKTLLLDSELSADRLFIPSDTPYAQDGAKVLIGAKANLDE